MVRWRAIRSGCAALAALAVVVTGPAAAQAGEQAPSGYRTAEGARPVQGKDRASQAPRLRAGTYTDSIERGAEKWYALTLDDTSDAYVSAVAAPAPGGRGEAYGDSLKISIQDSSGRSCGSEGNAVFRGSRMAYPVADYATRRIEPGKSTCQSAGPYYVVLKREGRLTSGAGAWPVELKVLDEPGVRGSAPEQPAPGSWSTATPPPPTNDSAAPGRASGGTGFNDAASVGGGVWKDRIRPGQTRFYRVPLDWGQRLNVSAELSDAPGPRRGHLSNALGMSVYNPARGAVSGGDFVSYGGKPAAVKFFTAPVDYGNRFSSTDAIGAMRFAGWYYVAVSLHPDAAKFFATDADLTLRVGVDGARGKGPAYRVPTKDFSVSDQDREAAGTGRSVAAAERSGTLRTVGYAGIGAGVVLLAGLGAWVLVARRGAGGAAGPGGGGVPPQYSQGSREALEQPSRGAPGQGQPTQGGPGQQPPSYGQQTQQSQQFGPPQGW